MVFSSGILRNAGPGRSFSLGFQRWVHTMFQPAPLQSSLDHLHTTCSPMVLPEAEIDYHNPNFSSIHGSMELMAVPKRKVSPHKRGIRNGPKALKPVPVIVRCMVCGKVKLPHFFCCGGKPRFDGQNGSVS